MAYVKVTGRVAGLKGERTAKDMPYLPFRVERAEAFDDDDNKLDVEKLEGTPVPLGLFTTIIDKVNLRKLKDAEILVRGGTYPGLDWQFGLLKKMSKAGYDIEGLALTGHFWDDDKFEAYRIEVLPKSEPAQNKYDAALSHYLEKLRENFGDYGEKKAAQKIAKSETG